MSWSIETTDDGFGILWTVGKSSRTVYFAYTAQDAERLVEAMEFHQAMNNVATPEVIQLKAKKAGR